MVQVGSKEVNSVGAPAGIEVLENRWVELPVMRVDQASDVVGEFIDIARNPLHQEENAQAGTEEVDVGSKAVEVRLRAACTQNGG